MLAGSIPFALQISFHSFSANVIDSTCKFQSQMTFRLCTLFLKRGSHYPKLMRDNSTNASNFTSFVFNESHYYREPTASAGGGSSQICKIFLDNSSLIVLLLSNR